MSFVEKEKELSDYLAMWLRARYTEWTEFSQEANKNTRNGICRLEKGTELLQLLRDIIGNIDEIYEHENLGPIIPCYFSSIGQLLLFLNCFKAHIENHYYLLEINMGKDGADYYIGPMHRMIQDIYYMVDRCNQNYLQDDQIPIPYLQVRKALMDNDINKFVDLVSCIINDLPYSIRKEKINEGYFHTVFHVITFVIGLNPLSETETANGRIDVSFETPSKIYLIEFKYSGNNTDKSEQALKQIKDKKYDLSYHTTGKVIEGIGISYSAKKRNINGIKNEVLYSPS